MFKLGSRVKVSVDSGFYEIQGKFGVGTVVALGYGGFHYKVDFDNGKCRLYDDEDLVRATPAFKGNK